MYKNSYKVVSVSTFAILSLMFAVPAHAVTSCTDATVTGSYSASGSAILPDGTTGYTFVGIMDFDGAGKARESYTYVGGSKVQTVLARGKYKVNSRCQINFTLTNFENGVADGVVTSTGVIVSGGTKINAILTSSSTGPVYPIAIVYEAVR